MRHELPEGDRRRALAARMEIGHVSSHRRVETESTPLRFVSPAPIERSVDSSLGPGERVIDQYGVPAQATSVTRKDSGTPTTS